MNEKLGLVNTAPWYRQRWPWLLISLPATAVIAGVVTWYVAWRSNDGLVADDYYKQGLEINRSLASQQMAAQLGLKAELAYSAGRFVLSLGAEREITLPQELRLSLTSPTRAGQDRDVLLRRDGAVYVAAAPAQADGHWNLVLEDLGKLWKLRGNVVFPLHESLVLKP